MFLAVTSDGSLFWQFLEGNNNRYTTIDVLLTLIKHLDATRPGWRHNHILIHDNCPSFASHDVQAVLSHFNVPCLFTAPASFKALPVEGIF
jgi:hypothetical protein